MRNGILMKLLFSFYYLSPMCSFVKDQFPFFIYRCIMFCFLFGKLSSRTMKSIFISRQLSGRVPNGPWDWKNFSVKYFHRDFFVFFLVSCLRKKQTQTKIISLSTAILPPYLCSGKEFLICFLKFQKEKF